MRHKRKILLCFALLLLVGCSQKEELPQPVENEKEYVFDYENPYVKKLLETYPDDVRAKEIASNIQDYREDFIELALHNTDTLDFLYYSVYEIENDPTIPLSDLDFQDDYPALYQWDLRWGTHMYGGDVMALTGCAPTVLATVFSKLLDDKTITPYTMAELSMQEGYFVEGIGTSWTFLTAMNERFGIVGNEIIADEETIASHLQEGHPVIMSMVSGDFTRTGHFILLKSIDEEGNVSVQDPNSKIRSNKTWSITTLVEQCAGAWYYAKS